MANQECTADENETANDTGDRNITATYSSPPLSALSTAAQKQLEAKYQTLREPEVEQFPNYSACASQESKKRLDQKLSVQIREMEVAMKTKAEENRTKDDIDGEC